MPTVLPHRAVGLPRLDPAQSAVTRRRPSAGAHEPRGDGRSAPRLARRHRSQPRRRSARKRGRRDGRFERSHVGVHVDSMGVEDRDSHARHPGTPSAQVTRVSLTCTCRVLAARARPLVAKCARPNGSAHAPSRRLFLRAEPVRRKGNSATHSSDAGFANKQESRCVGFSREPRVRITVVAGSSPLR